MVHQGSEYDFHLVGRQCVGLLCPVSLKYSCHIQSSGPGRWARNSDYRHAQWFIRQIAADLLRGKTAHSAELEAQL